MNKILLIPYFLIGFCYTFLLYNKIAFGVCLILGTISLFILKHKNFNLRLKFNDNKVNVSFLLTVVFFLISSCLSIKPERSILVTIYFVFFVLVSLNLFAFLVKDIQSYEKILSFFIISTVLNISFIFLYNLYQSGILSGDYQVFEIKKFKGVLNIISILVTLMFFFKHSKLFYIPIFFLIPSLYLSNSNAPILGFFLGGLLVFFFVVARKFHINKKKIFSSLIILFVFGSLFINQLPSKFDDNSVQNQKFTVPISILDAHRQFIWGFSLSKFTQKPFLGYGPDTSNFIEDGQTVIGSIHTGTMKFIPSHPHNFFIELLLETGIIGTSLFIIFILFLNYRIFHRSNFIEKKFLIFFNGYFWGASLVNFSYWQAWWQASYFLILCFLAVKIIKRKKILEK